MSVAKSASNTLKLFHDQEIMDRFVQSSQAKFWSDKGHPFKVLSPEECFRRVPLLSSKTRAREFSFCYCFSEREIAARLTAFSLLIQKKTVGHWSEVPCKILLLTPWRISRQALFILHAISLAFFNNHSILFFSHPD